MADYWQEIAIANGITEPSNGSWLQAICESLGIETPVNGSWLQGLAQYGPFGGGPAPIDNTVTVENFEIYSYSAGTGPKGLDVWEFAFTLNSNLEESPENIQMIVTDQFGGFKYTASNDLSGGAQESRGVVFEPFNTLQGFYYEQYLGSAPDAYIFDVQLFNKVTGQKSEILTFNLPLTAI